MAGLGLDGHTAQRRELTDQELTQARDKLRGVDNVFGKHMVREFTMGTYGLGLVERNAARLDAWRIRLAMRVYEKRHGSLPPRLDDLVTEKLLPEVSRDPYDGQSFKYSPQTRVVWCVGAKGTNTGVIPPQRDGGDPFFENIELTWKIPKP